MIIEEESIGETPLHGFNNPDEAQTIASNMYKDGTDVIFTVACYSGSSAITEAKRARGR